MTTPIERFKRRYKNLTKLEVELIRNLSQADEEKIFKIVNVKQFTLSQEDGTELEALEIWLKPPRRETLWIKNQVSENSKLGAFLSAFLKAQGEEGRHPANWIGMKVKIVKWRPGDRKVEVLAGGEGE